MTTDEITIELKEHAEEAVLLLPAQSDINKEDILQKISAQKICFGLDAAAILAACTACNTDQRIIIAQGQKALDSTPSLLISALDIEGDTLVTEGQLIGELSNYIKGTAGMNVLGQAIPPASCDTMMPIGSGLEIRHHQIYASIDGNLYKDKENIWHVSTEYASPIELTLIELDLSDDLFLASITLQANEWINPSVLLAAIQNKNVIFGFIQEALENVSEPNTAIRTITVAQGQLPIDGSDAYLEKFIDDSVKFTIAQDGSIDFKSASVFKNIQSGTELARLHAPGEPVAGMDILGNKIEAQSGAELAMENLISEGACLSGTDSSIIVAERDGIYNNNPQGQIGILQLLVIDGNVDMKVGNIETPYPVIIKGDIKSGYIVKSGSDISVEGIIEDSKVTAAGNITVSKGIIPGKERIKARGDLAALYIREREVKARSILVNKSIRRSNIFATGDLHAQELLGGSAIVAETIEVETLGSETGHRTEVTVGVDPYLKSLLNTLIETYHEMNEEAEKLEPLVESTNQRAHDLGKKFKLLRDEKQDKNYLASIAQQAKRALDESNRIRDDLRYALQKKKVLSGKIHTINEKLRAKEHNSRILIHGTAWAPTTMHIGSDASYRIESPIEKATIYLNKDGKIKLARESESPAPNTSE
ncbi:MAG: DUF342 domain-containing protein [Planctomycetes bacterium]|nr:DUF342 domain-containing protein [Planctomycetota bacterium]